MSSPPPFIGSFHRNEMLRAWVKQVRELDRGLPLETEKQETLIEA